MNIIGISAHFHDAACCLVQDGRLTAAAQEERFTRLKHDPRLPTHAFRYCLEEAGLNICDIDCVAYYERPHNKFARQLWMGLPSMLQSDLYIHQMDPARPTRDIRESLGYDGPIEFVDHHLSHAASSFFYSGFSEAAVLTVDGVGEWATTAYGKGSSSGIEIFEEVNFPHSLGLLYSTITNYLGFEVNDGEYKVMGLAPYGKPRFTDRIRLMIRSGTRGSYHLELSYFDFLRKDRMFSERLIQDLEGPPRTPESSISERHCDIAHSLQRVLEEVLVEKVAYLYRQIPSENLCMAGGVALNCVANSRVLREGPFKRLFVPPAANDAGGCVGAATVAYRKLTKSAHVPTQLTTALFGPAYPNEEVRQLLEDAGLPAVQYQDRESELLEATVLHLMDRKVIGWFQGRMEFGPRALGSRSILADPRDVDMRDKINAMVKKRESFRPFAPAVRAEQARQHFDLCHDSPFMLETFPVTSSLSLPAVTHVDNSARVQTVTERDNPRFWRLLETFEQRTGCPILLNTSFNLRGEPIVCTPEDAVLRFLLSSLDVLVIEDFIIDRQQVPEAYQAMCTYFQRVGTSKPQSSVYPLF